MSRFPRPVLPAVFFLLAIAAQAADPTPPDSAGLTPAEVAGKKVFIEGISPTGMPIQALVGTHSTPVSGEALPCASCHGPDGLGRPEGATKPSNITWQELTKSYGHRFESGRERGPYTDQKFYEAVTYGTDSSGNKLDPTMPRYVMANADLANMLAYLKRIDADLDPGVATERLRIGTLLPTSGRQAEVGAAMREVMLGHIATINARGGIFGRQLELVVADLPDTRAGAAEAAERLLREGKVFALVAPFAAGIEQPLFAAAEAAKVPVVGPSTLAPDDGGAVNRQTFYLLPGPQDQARALADFAAKELQLENPVSAVVHVDDEPELAAAVADRLAGRGWKQVVMAPFARRQPDPAKLVARLQQQGVQVIFFLGDDAELAMLGQEVRDAIWTPYLLALGPRVERSAARLPTTFGDRVFLAYPTLTADVTPKGMQELAALAPKPAAAAGAAGADHAMHGMQPAAEPARQRHQLARIIAYAAMLVLEEGLKRAGRDLSRVKFTAALEKLFSFETGVMPTITFGPNRRIGALGAHIVAVDLAGHRFRPTGRYMRVD